MTVESVISIGDIDNFLAETGQFTLIEWLLAQNILPYRAYENWRNGDVAAMDEVVRLSEQNLLDLIQEAANRTEHLNLASQAHSYYGWRGSSKKLLISRNSVINQGLSLVWKRPEDLPQMDLFMDNSAVVCENQVQFDLAARDYSCAQTALQKLTRLNPSHSKLGAYQDLINYGVHIQTHPLVATEDIVGEMEGLQGEVLPLAKETLKHYSRDYLAAAWRRLASCFAQGCASEALEPLAWPHHACFALSQIPDWPAVKEHFLAHGDAYSLPALAQCLSEAYFFSDEPNLGFVVWGQIGERFPDYLEANIGAANSGLLELWDGFLAFDEHWPNEWFLSYLLIQRPGFIHLLSTLTGLDAAPIKNDVNQATFDLITAKVENRDQSLYRAQLKARAPALLRCFMNKQPGRRRCCAAL